MALSFADTSAVAKLYFSEAGSVWLRTLDLSSLAVSLLALPELASALARRQREGALSPTDAHLVWRRFRGDLRRWSTLRLTSSIVNTALMGYPNLDILDVTREIARRAAEMRARHRLRAIDGLQVATAIQAGATAFLTNDQCLRRVDEIPVLLIDDFRDR